MKGFMPLSLSMPPNLGQQLAPEVFRFGGADEANDHRGFGKASGTNKPQHHVIAGTLLPVTLPLHTHLPCNRWKHPLLYNSPPGPIKCHYKAASIATNSSNFKYFHLANLSRRTFSSVY